mmetsp:Transcript_15670/g.32190  ORF Transcript_15670/g.32190 Transcript_15670/m.32190 type:complete len:451 (+) Transcript_15670:325-1677(+)
MYFSSLSVTLAAMAFSVVGAEPGPREPQTSAEAFQSGFRESLHSLASGTSIINGEDAAPGEFPYYVFLGNCGGILIAPDVVLTAAHCGEVTGKQVAVGAYVPFTLEGGAQQSTCVESIMHPNWRFLEPLLRYDVQLCKLDTAITIDQSKVRLQLNNEASFPSVDQDLVAIGLGANYTDQYGFQDFPDILQKTTLSHLDPELCKFTFELFEDVLCAGIVGSSACFGDSGGPLVAVSEGDDGIEVHTLVGVTSFVTDTVCSEMSGYAKVSFFADWIESTMCSELNSASALCDSPVPKPEVCDQNLSVKFLAGPYAFFETWSLWEDSKDLIVDFQDYLVSFETSERDICLKPGVCYTWKYNFKPTSLGEVDVCAFLSGVCSGVYVAINSDEEVLVPLTESISNDLLSVKFCTPEAPTAAPTAAPTKKMKKKKKPKNKEKQKNKEKKAKDDASN